MSKHAQTLLIDGPDARTFAHAQFSSNVKSLAVGQWQFSAWLNASGRVRALFHLARLGHDTYLLVLRGGDAASIAGELGRFVFRARLTLKALPGRHVATGAPLILHAAEQTGGALRLGCGTHSMDVGEIAGNDDAWPTLQLRMGWPWLPASVLDDLLPADLSLQHLGAVVVDKGCYPGQEIVARLHFRGGQKRHLHCGTLSQPRAPGDVLRMDGQAVGVVLDVHSDGSLTEAQFVLADVAAARLREDTKTTMDENLQVLLTHSWSG